MNAQKSKWCIVRKHLLLFCESFCSWFSGWSSVYLRANCICKGKESFAVLWNVTLLKQTFKDSLVDYDTISPNLFITTSLLWITYYYFSQTGDIHLFLGLIFQLLNQEISNLLMSSWKFLICYVAYICILNLIYLYTFLRGIHLKNLHLQICKRHYDYGTLNQH